MKTVLITGVNGFVGQHLTQELITNDCKVIGIGRERQADTRIAEDLSSYYAADLAQEWPSVAEPVDAIIHLAGLAAVGPSFDDPQTYINLNSAMLTYMAEHYLQQEHRPRILVISSGAIYDANQPMPLTESSRVGFNSPYAVSKILVENQCAYYCNRGLDCIVVRPFNHIGPGQLPGFLVPDLAQQLAAADKDGVIEVGNLTTRRDYTDVRDVARAYRLLATTTDLHASLYNVCSGKSISGEEVLEQLQTAMDRTNITVSVDKNRFRPTDVQEIYGDASRLQADTGWQPEIPLSQTIRDFTALL